MSEWRYGSGRSGKPNIPPSKSRNMKCPQCGKEVTVYSDGSIERHKVYKKDKQGRENKNSWAWCTKKKV